MFSPGLIAFTGRIGDACAHAHTAVQVLFVAHGGLHLTDAAGRILLVEAVITPMCGEIARCAYLRI